MTMYQKAVIYKICCNDINISDTYVGSTCNFTRRKYGHKSVCKNEKNKEYNKPVYQFIRNNGGFDNFSMVLIEKYPCENKIELASRERYWIETLEATLNKNIPTRTIKEYYESNREKFKEYRENNKEKIKEYRENNKEKIKEYRENNKEKIKEYKKEWYKNNKEKLNQKHKEYNEKNKARILEQKKEKYTCTCGSILSKSNKSQHEKTKKHINFIESQNE